MAVLKFVLAITSFGRRPFVRLEYFGAGLGSANRKFWCLWFSRGSLSCCDPARRDVAVVVGTRHLSNVGACARVYALTLLLRHLQTEYDE
jgi:hypothetical protein